MLDGVGPGVRLPRRQLRPGDPRPAARTEARLGRARPDRADRDQAQPLAPPAGQAAWLLPCLVRAEEDGRRPAPQAVTIEDSLSHDPRLARPAHAGLARICCPRSPSSRAWPRRRCRRTRRCAGTTGRATTRRIRDLIEETYPDEFDDFNAGCFTPGGFYRGNAARDRTWKTESGKAEFTAPAVLTALGGDPERRGADPRHAALERPVQHDDLRLSPTVCAVSRAARRRRSSTPRRSPGAGCPRDSGRPSMRRRGRDRGRCRASRWCLRPAGRLRRRLLSGGQRPDPGRLHDLLSKTPAYKGVPVRVVPSEP